MVKMANIVFMNLILHSHYLLKRVLNFPTDYTDALVDFLEVHSYKWVDNLSIFSKKLDRKPVLLSKQENFVVVIGDSEITVVCQIMVEVSNFFDRLIDNTILY